MKLKGSLGMPHPPVVVPRQEAKPRPVQAGCAHLGTARFYLSCQPSALWCNRSGLKVGHDLSREQLHGAPDLFARRATAVEPAEDIIDPCVGAKVSDSLHKVFR